MGIGPPAILSTPLQTRFSRSNWSSPAEGRAGRSRDKLCFFAGYEGLWSFIGNTIGTAVPYTGPGQQAAHPRNSMVDAIHFRHANGATLSPLNLKLLGCTLGPVACKGGYIQNAPSSSTTYVSTLPNTHTGDNGVTKIDYHINSKHMINGTCTNRPIPAPARIS